MSDAHGDSSVSEDDPVTSDVATPADVVERLDPNAPPATPATPAAQKP